MAFRKRVGLGLLALGFGILGVFQSCAVNHSPAAPFAIPPTLTSTFTPTATPTPPANYITEWGTDGSGNGQFYEPQGLAVNPASTTLYAADYNNRVQAFDLSGNYLTQWGNSTQFGGPEGIAINSAGTSIYVVAYANNRVEVFNGSGSFITQWGSPGSGNGQFNIPSGIAINSAGTTVYVADEYNNRVQAFSGSGAYLTQWGTEGAGNGQFFHPYGIATISDGEVYVTDSNNGRVEEFNGMGTYITQWSGYLYNPVGIVVNPINDLIYIVDAYGCGWKFITFLVPTSSIGEVTGLRRVISIVPLLSPRTLRAIFMFPTRGITGLRSFHRRAKGATPFWL